jgi:hypothetical protein
VDSQHQSLWPPEQGCQPLESKSNPKSIDPSEMVNIGVPTLLVLAGEWECSAGAKFYPFHDDNQKILARQFCCSRNSICEILTLHDFVRSPKGTHFLFKLPKPAGEARIVTFAFEQ